MSWKKKIYFSPFGYLISLIQNMFKFIHQPFMVYGYYNQVKHRFYRNVRISSSSYITDKNKLDIEDNVWINHYVRIDASGGVKIGKGCQIGYGSAILSHSSHNAIRLNGESYINLDVKDRIGYIHKHVRIGEFTFIGGGSTILPGVTIGRGCVIGVGAVVNRDVPDYAIVVGVPAKIIGDTRETDKQFVKNPFFEGRYYDKRVIEDYLK